MREEIHTGSHLKIILKGAGIFILGTLISRILTYITRIFIARYFGSESYGLFNLGLAIVGFSIVFCLIGLPLGVQRYIAYYSARGENGIVKGILIFSLIVSGGISIIISGLIFILSDVIAKSAFNSPDFGFALKIFAISIPFAALSQILFSAFIGFKKLKYMIYTERIASNLFKLIFIILFGIFGYGIVGLALGNTLGLLVTFLLALYFLENKVFSLKTKTRPIFLKKEIIFFSLPLMLSSLMNSILARLDTLMLGYFRSAQEVGIYNAAIPTSQMLYIVTGSLGALLLPVLTELYAKNQREELRAVYKTVVKWAVYLNLPVFLIIALFSHQVLNIMFGSEYVDGYLALSILSIGFFAGTFSFGASSLLTMDKKTHAIFLASFISSILNFILNFLLIPTYGITGAAIATSSSYLVYSVVLIIYSWRRIGISPFSVPMLKSLPVGFLALAVVYTSSKIFFTSFNLYILASLLILFILLYAILLLFFSGLQEEDIIVLKTIERKTGLKNDKIKTFIKKFIK